MCIAKISYIRYIGGAKMCGPMGMRGFLTKEERIEMLKEYKEDLEKETKGVAERIKELESN